MEYQYYDTELQAAFMLPAGVTTGWRGIGYVMSAMTPDAESLPTPGQCQNFDTTHGWPIGVGTPHTDLDVGASIDIVGPNGAGTMTTTSIAKQAAGIDGIGRPHDIFYQSNGGNAADVEVGNAAYTVSFAGNGTDIGATTFQDGIFMPADYAVSSPGLEDNGPLVAGTDFTVAWTPGNNTNLAAGDDVAELIWLIDVMGHPTHLCVTSHDAGTFTIPGATIAEYQADAAARGLPTAKVVLARQAIVHHFVKLPLNDTANKRRFDMIGIMCWLQLMDVQ